MLLSLFLLGPPRVEIDGEAIAFPRQKSLALLVHLAVTGEQQRRDTLAALLWPESADARGSLRRELSSLKSALGNGDWLDADRETISLTGEIRLDVHDFLTAARSDDPARLAQAADLYRDDFLTGFSLADAPDFDDWRFFASEEYRRTCAAALERLIAHHQNRGDPDAAIPYARRLLALDNLHEPSHRLLMRLYALTSQHSAALRQYDECVRLLDEELGVPPEQETTELHEAIRTRRFPAEDDRRTGGPGEGVTSPSHPVTPSPGHLPTPATSFIGRERELSELSALLSRPDMRLAVVVAPGGMGKTRFAIEAARQLAGDFPDGVWFASLVGVSEASQMLAALVQLLGAPMGAGDAKDALLRFFARRRLLLVLDNFEQLADAAPVLADLLASGPDVKLLVTSRVRLNLREEWVFPLAGLATADDGRQTTDERVEAGSAVRLFVERAGQVQPDFDAEADAEAVAAICRAVEGMPLGIELAASWLRAMNCGEIVAEIRRDVDFLRTSLRNVPEQHRSMRAVFERSWALLTEDEQQGLARLSVFQGGFTRAAAEAVAEVRLPLLSGLVDHSLLRHAASGRYDIHELLRQFAAEQLGKNGEAEAIQDKHADYFLRFLSERRADLEWRRLQEALGELIPERENLFAGWRWACQRALFPQIRIAAKVLPLYCNLTSAQENGLQLFDQAIAAAEAKVGPEDERPGLLGILRWRQQCYLQPSHHQPDAYLERLFATRALLLESKEDVQNELARMSGAIGTQLATVGKGEEGARWMEDAIRHFTERRAFVDLGKVYCRFALLRLGEGKLFQSDEIFGRAADAWGQAKLPAYPLIFRSSVYLQQGRFEEAQRLLEQAREMGDDPFMRDFPSMGGPGIVDYELSQTTVALGALDAAMLHFQRVREISEAEGRPWAIAHSPMYTPGTILRLQGKMQAARRQIENDVAIVRSVGFKQRIVARLDELARLEYDEGSYAASEAALNEALDIAEAIDSRLARALTLCQMGHTAAVQGKPEATGYYCRALDIAAEQGMNGILTDVLRGAAQLRADAGDVTQAVEWLALVAGHPNAEWETKQKALKALTEWEGHLSAQEFSAAKTRGGKAELATVIPAVLAWLA